MDRPHSGHEAGRLPRGERSRGGGRPDACRARAHRRDGSARAVAGERYPPERMPTWTSAPRGQAARAAAAPRTASLPARGLGERSPSAAASPDPAVRPAVDDERRARHPRGLVATRGRRTRPRCRAACRDVPSGCRPSRAGARGLRIGLAVEEALEHRRLRESRADAVRADAGLRAVEGHALREHDRAGLGRAVGRLSARAPEPDHGCRDRDRAAALDEVRPRRLRTRGRCSLRFVARPSSQSASSTSCDAPTTGRRR